MEVPLPEGLGEEDLEQVPIVLLRRGDKVPAYWEGEWQEAKVTDIWFSPFEVRFWVRVSHCRTQEYWGHPAEPLVRFRDRCGRRKS